MDWLTSPGHPKVTVARLVVHGRGAATAATGSRGLLAEGRLLRLRLGPEGRLGLEAGLKLRLERRLGLELRPEGRGSLGRRAAA